eukprot:1532097-Pyramimonas_sp.AAC.1
MSRGRRVKCPCPSPLPHSCSFSALTSLGTLADSSPPSPLPLCAHLVDARSYWHMLGVQAFSACEKLTAQLAMRRFFSMIYGIGLWDYRGTLLALLVVLLLLSLHLYALFSRTLGAPRLTMGASS